MNYLISAQAQRHAAEILSLLRAYSAAGYSSQEIFVSVSTGYDMNDIRAYAKTDQMPVRVRGKLYPVSEIAASRIAGTCVLLERMRSEGVSDPVATCAGVLEYILSGLQNRRKITITLIDAKSGQVALSTPGTNGQAPSIAPVMAACNALEMDTFDANILCKEDVELVAQQAS